jgi:hypothetical protein
MRKIESLPDEQVYQILDYIEFLESKYAVAAEVEASGLQKFAEGLEDKLRRKAVSPSTIREAFQLISAADRVLSGVSSAGRRVLSDLNQVMEPEDPTNLDSAASDDAQRIEADPRKRRTSSVTETPDTQAADRGGAEPTSDAKPSSRSSEAEGR